MKITYDGETRRMRLARGNFAELSLAVRSAFPTIRGDFKLEYTDDEGDVCAVCDDATLSEMWFVLEAKGGTMRFNVSTVEPARRRRTAAAPAAAAAAAPPAATASSSSNVVDEGAPDGGLTAPERLAVLDVELDRLLGEFESCAGTRALPDRFQQRVEQIRSKFAQKIARVSEALRPAPAVRRCDELQRGAAERLQKVVGRAIAAVTAQLVEGDTPDCRRGRGCRARGGGRRHRHGNAPGSDSDDQDAAAAQAKVVHRGITCDGCGVGPIRGIRYKSATRQDFDLCERCESARWADKEDVFLKIRHPEQAPRAIFAAVGGEGGERPDLAAQFEAMLAANRSGEGVDPAALFGGRGGGGGGGCRRRFGGRFGRGRCGGGGHPAMRFLQRMAEAAAANGGFEGPGEWRRQAQAQAAAAEAPAGTDASGQAEARPADRVEQDDADVRASLAAAPQPENDEERQLLEAAIRASMVEAEAQSRRQAAAAAEAGASSASSVSALPAQELQSATNSGGEAPELRAHFMAHTTMAGRPTIEPGASFIKGWRLANPGPAAWPRGTRLVRIEPSQLQSVGSVAVPQQVLPGESVSLSVQLTAPTAPGRYQSYWRLMAPSGEQFGHRLWADVFVANSNVGQVLASLAAGEPASSDARLEAPTTAAAAAATTAAAGGSSAAVLGGGHYDDDVLVEAPKETQPLLAPVAEGERGAGAAAAPVDDDEDDDGVVVEPEEEEEEEEEPVYPAPSAPAVAAVAAPTSPFEQAVQELMLLGIGSEADVRAALAQFHGSKDRAANALLSRM